MDKKNVSNEIRQRNRKKKLLYKSSTKDLSISKGPASSVDKESRLHKKKEAENIMQDVFDFTMNGSKKNHMIEILLTGCEENNCQEKIESQRSLVELLCSNICWRNFIIGLKYIVQILLQNYPIARFKLLLIISPKIPILNYQVIRMSLS